MSTTSTGHKIVSEPSRETVRVVFQGAVIARTQRAVILRETGMPPVYYIPREDTNMEYLARSALMTRCPYKGLAHYFDIVRGQTRCDNAIWTYEEPIPAAAAIANHLAFYADRVEIEREPRSGVSRNEHIRMSKPE
jgi:uncharacterized protein (DUF427 family)